MDISQCEFIDSTFLGVLVIEHKKMIANNGILNIVRPINTNINFLHLTQVLDHLNMYETRSEAIEYFDQNIPIQKI